MSWLAIIGIVVAVCIVVVVAAVCLLAYAVSQINS